MRSVVPEQPQVIEAVEKLCRQDDFGAQRGKPLFQIRPGGAPVVANQLQRLSNHNRGRDKALLRVASDSLFEGVVNSLRDILGVEVNSLSRERLQCPCPVPNEKHECRAGRIGAPSQPEYFTWLRGRVDREYWFN